MKDIAKDSNKPIRNTHFVYINRCTALADMIVTSTSVVRAMITVLKSKQKFLLKV